MQEQIRIPKYDLKNVVTTSRLRGLWRLMTGFRGVYMGATASLAVAAAAKSLTYLLLRYLVDSVLGQSQPGTTYALIGAGFVGLALIEGGFTFMSGRLAARTAEGVAKRLRDYLYDTIQRLTFSYHDHMQTGELVQRSTSDVDALRRFFADQAIGVGRIFLLFAVNFGAVLALNVRLALYSIIVVPLVVVLSVLFFRRVSAAYERYQEQEAVLSTTLQENLAGVRVVKAFARQEYERAKFERENWEKFRRGRRFMFMHSLYWPVSDVLCGAQMLGGFTAGALMAISGTITVGTYLAYAGLLVWIIFPMRNLGRLIVQTSTGLVSFGRVVDVISQQREDLDAGDRAPAQACRGEIVFDDVSFSYDGKAPVLHDVTFRCEPGQAVALLGGAGSGKTSLVNLLPRFYDYSGGSIRLDGEELASYTRKYLRSQIGIVEQEPFLFSRSIRDNITYGVSREVSDAEVEAAARAAAIHDVILSFPEGYATLVGERGVTLSGGQKQRVAIARTILKDPRILILDDATSSVDTETEGEIRDALAGLMQGRTSFIIAHRVQSLMNADLILVFDRGMIVQRGTHQELIEQAGIYRQVYELQARIDDELEREDVSAAGETGAFTENA